MMRAIMMRLAWRFLKEPDKRLLLRFARGAGWNSMRAIRKFEERRRKGIIFPAFFFISLTNNCNLRCQGCWVSPTSPPRELDLKVLGNFIRSCKAQGSSFFGLLGGEPLLYRGLLDLLAEHQDCYFLIFTNGTLVTEDVARRFRELGNVTPLVSIEGLESVSDERRGGRDVYGRTLAGLDACRRQRLITGVATSVCKSNFKDVVSEAFLKDLAARGVLYMWYYIYRPVGPDPCPDLKLSPEEIVELRRFIVDMRDKVPIMVVDAYWDHEGRAMCPAATGIAAHISPEGYVEPCPPLQLAGDNIGDGTDVYERISRSAFLGEFRTLSAGTTRGCIIMERPDLLNTLRQEKGAVDSSLRGTMASELARMTPAPSHHIAGSEIPETNAFYRFAKKRWFFGFGAYG